MSFLRRLWTACLEHDDYRERDGQGRLELVCRTCGDRRHVLEGEMLKGPQYEQHQDLGTCTTKARKAMPMIGRKRA
jgi:hypothetical protein